VQSDQSGVQREKENYLHADIKPVQNISAVVKKNFVRKTEVHPQKVSKAISVTGRGDL
jgi:hypothetical protein